MRIGIDLGGSKIEGVVMDIDDAILARRRRETPQDRGYAAIVDTIGGLVDELENDTCKGCRVGVGTPGVLDRRTGLIKNSNSVCMIGRPLKRDLEARLQRTVRLENDANCFALSEASDGAGQGHTVVFGVIMGTGVGGGLVVNGELLPGRHRIAGEWGHNVLEPDGPACYCGKRGCVETLLSGPGLSRDYAFHGGETDVAAAQIIARAAHGEAAAQAALTRFLERFGKALATVINLLDPHAIVIGGGLSNIAHLYDAGRAQVARHVFNDSLSTPIVRNRHGDSSGVRGAARLWPAQTSVP